MLELLKVMVQPVVLERDENGKVMGERLGEATALYTQEQIDEFFTNLRQTIERENASLNGKIVIPQGVPQP